MANLEEAKLLWRDADAVTFDVDSTVIREEGIDELAKFCGKGDEVSELTRRAMQGNVTFERSLGMRLDIIRPTLSQVQEFLAANPPKLTPGIESLMRDLRARQKELFLISGGFRRLIEPVAARLGIPSENVYANRLKFDAAGEYAGFEEKEPTARSGGKAEVIRRLKEERALRRVVHVGDGATDAEAAPPADLFIGYGGNVVREAVRSRSPWYVLDFGELSNAL
ncbi:hypothetical protein KM043_010461 [Ampulex compressa]|nr:hypothetical protein KM043_010461 [Ampulex compressa]